MSTTFRIQNKSKDILTTNLISRGINENLLIGRNSSITFESWVKDEFHDLGLDMIEIWNLGLSSKSLRGVIIFYSNDNYNVKVNSPANLEDWYLAYKIIRFLMKKTNSNAYNIEQKKYYSLYNLETFDHLNEIKEGYEAIKIVLHQNLTPALQGFNLNSFLDSEYIEKCGDNLESFLDISTDIQWSAYTANPSYIIKIDKVIAVYYVLGSNLDTYLPKSPILPDEYEIDDTNLEWIIVFTDQVSGNIGAMNYQEFIKKIIKLEMVDANNFMISLNKQEMIKILKHRKTKTKMIDILNQKG